MVTSTEERITSTVFSKTFEQMCNFIAIAKTGDAKKTVEGLISLCLLELPSEHFSTPTCFKDTIGTLFGIDVPIAQIDDCLNMLEKSGVISRPTSEYKLNKKNADALRQKINEARGVEERVKAKWFEELQVSFPALPADDAWKTLREYLSRTFRRHGIQAVALLDPSITTPAEHDMSLSFILKQAIEQNLPTALHKLARPALSGFMAKAGDDDDRAHYIAQLADGAFNFYTLEVPQDLSEALRSRLNELTLFLDTNFLFGILDLHYNTQAQVSHDLLRAISTQKFPFKLRYHEATADEMTRTIGYYGGALKSRVWTSSLSRAAAQSRFLSGIEQKFHMTNAMNAIDVDEFIRKYEHFDRMLDDKNIKIYKTIKDDREQARIDLYHDYNEFLKSNNKDDKPYEIVMHDAKVLDTVRHLRTNASSSLHAGALIITCDYFLYRFDWENARRTGQKACVLLPNIFWQILRPFMQGNNGFEKAFAETFALPEFRALSSGASRACSKMLQILATYKDLPEQTALNLLSNGLLVDNLTVAHTDREFEEQIEIAFVEENRSLMEEKASYARQLVEEQQARAERESELDKAKRDIAAKAGALALQESALKEKEAALASLQAQDALKTREIQQTATQVVKEQKEKEELQQQVVAAQGATARVAIVSSVCIAALVVVVLELLLNLVFKWQWLLAHSNSYGLQACFSAMVFSFILSIGIKPWRKWLLGAVFFGVLLVAIQLLGGPSAKP